MEIFRVARDDKSLLIKMQSSGSPKAKVFGVESCLTLVDDLYNNVSMEQRKVRVRIKDGRYSHAARKSWRAKFQNVAFRALEGLILCDISPGLVGDCTGIMPSFSARSKSDLVPLR
jgi:hypothetical protein